MVRTIGEDESERKVIEDIASFGWHCVHVLAEGDLPEYAFTIGLFHTYKQPELIIFGLPCKVSHPILGVAADTAKSGRILDLEQPSDELLNGASCCFAKVPTSKYGENVGFCCWYYRGNDFPLYQIVWPSREGLFPWHPKASREFRQLQPVITTTPGGT